MAGSPLLIYAVRQALTRYYAYVTSRQQKHLEALNKQRDGVIAKLKAATKYDSTQQLLEKYGGAPAKGKRGNTNSSNGAGQARKASENKGGDAQGQGQGLGRPTVIPPPTANIPRNDRGGLASMPNTPQRSTPVTPGLSPPFTAAAASAPWTQQQDSQARPHPLSQSQSPISPGLETASFAPNAFNSAYSAPSGPTESVPRWYDRLLDVLLGEDEAHPKNRLALICANCRLVNGQAPPGVKRLEEVGKWKCAGCGAMNREGGDEVGKIVRAIHAEKEQEQNKGATGKIKDEVNEEPVLVSADTAEEEGEVEEVDRESDVTQYSSDELERSKQQVKIEKKVDTKPKAKARKSRKFEE